MAYIFRYKGREALGFLDLATLKTRAIEAGFSANAGIKQSIDGFDWVADDRVIFRVTAWRQYGMGFGAVNRDGSRLKWLSGVNRWEDNAGRNNSAQFWGGELLNSTPLDPRRVLMLNLSKVAYRNEVQPDVVQMNTLTGDFSIAQKNPGKVTGWLADPSGVIRFGLITDAVRTQLIHRDAVNGPWSEPIEFGTATAPFAYAGVDHSGTLMYYMKCGVNGRVGLFEYDLEEHRETRALFLHENYDASGTILSRDHRKLLGVRFVTEGPQVHWFDSEMRSIQQQINSLRPSLVNAIVSMDRRMNRFLVWSHSSEEPGIYSLLDIEAKIFQEVARPRSWIQAELMTEMNPIRCKARDGLQLNGYITMPRGRGQKNLPMVVLVHGGPWIRDEWGFDPLVQFLASRGYVVLQINYRGSSGYGREFLDQGKHQIGGAIQDDIGDATRWAVQQGLADPRRVAIMGGSYGGYSALFALGNTPDLYRCGIAFAAVTDWNELYRRKDEDEYRHAFKVWSERVGNLNDENVRRRLDAVSPVNLVEAMKAPVLMLHGERDVVVPIAQSKAIATKLGKTGHTVETLYFEDLGHELPVDEDGVKFLNRIESFLASHLK